MSPLRPLAARAVPMLTSMLLVAAGIRDAGAQTLRGSKDKVNRSYDFAKRRGIEFTTSRADIRLPPSIRNKTRRSMSFPSSPSAMS